jgi:hypothetical protein
MLEKGGNLIVRFQELVVESLEVAHCLPPQAQRELPLFSEDGPEIDAVGILYEEFIESAQVDAFGALLSLEDKDSFWIRSENKDLQEATAQIQNIVSLLKLAYHIGIDREWIHPAMVCLRFHASHCNTDELAGGSMLCLSEHNCSHILTFFERLEILLSYMVFVNPTKGGNFNNNKDVQKEDLHPYQAYLEYPTQTQGKAKKLRVAVWNEVMKRLYTQTLDEVNQYLELSLKQKNIFTYVLKRAQGDEYFPGNNLHDYTDSKRAYALLRAEYTYADLQQPSKSRSVPAPLFKNLNNALKQSASKRTTYGELIPQMIYPEIKAKPQRLGIGNFMLILGRSRDDVERDLEFTFDERVAEGGPWCSSMQAMQTSWMSWKQENDIKQRTWIKLELLKVGWNLMQKDSEEFKQLEKWIQEFSRSTFTPDRRDHMGLSNQVSQPYTEMCPNWRNGTCGENCTRGAHHFAQLPCKWPGQCQWPCGGWALSCPYSWHYYQWFYGSSNQPQRSPQQHQRSYLTGHHELIGKLRKGTIEKITHNTTYGFIGIHATEEEKAQGIVYKEIFFHTQYLGWIPELYQDVLLHVARDNQSKQAKANPNQIYCKAVNVRKLGQRPLPVRRMPTPLSSGR